MNFAPVLRLLERRRLTEAQWAARMELQGDERKAREHRMAARRFAEAAELIKEKQSDATAY